MDFTLPELPYAMDALEPVISRRTLEHHYGKHHAGYLTKLEAALADEDKSKSLEEIISQSYQQQNAAVFNSAAQVWNHTFYWNSMSAKPTEPSDERLKSLIEASFGSVDTLKEKLKASATGQFGSGWAWLVYSPGDKSLKVTSTSDAETPLTSDLVPLLTIDVWEHAYYLDYQQDRPGYVDSFLDKLINWDFAAANLPA